MKKYIQINDCYGGACTRLRREYESPEEFFKEVRTLKELSKEEVQKKYGGWHPLIGSNPILLGIELAEDEEYIIEEYDGLETLSFRKKLPIYSLIIERHDPKID